LTPYIYLSDTAIAIQILRQLVIVMDSATTPSRSRKVNNRKWDPFESHLIYFLSNLCVLSFLGVANFICYQQTVTTRDVSTFILKNLQFASPWAPSPPSPRPATIYTLITWSSVLSFLLSFLLENTKNL